MLISPECRTMLLSYACALYLLFTYHGKDYVAWTIKSNVGERTSFKSIIFTLNLRYNLRWLKKFAFSDHNYSNPLNMNMFITSLLSFAYLVVCQ